MSKTVSIPGLKKTIFIPANINMYMRVKLTERGRAQYAVYYPGSALPKPDEDGFHRFQIHQVMAIFGQYITTGMASSNPMSPGVEIEVYEDDVPELLEPGSVVDKAEAWDIMAVKNQRYADLQAFTRKYLRLSEDERCDSPINSVVQEWHVEWSAVKAELSKLVGYE